jgi:hypothetical protein
MRSQWPLVIGDHLEATDGSANDLLTHGDKYMCMRRSP